MGTNEPRGTIFAFQYPSNIVPVIVEKFLQITQNLRKKSFMLFAHVIIVALLTVNR